MSKNGAGTRGEQFPRTYGFLAFFGRSFSMCRRNSQRSATFCNVKMSWFFFYVKKSDDAFWENMAKTCNFGAIVSRPYMVYMYMYPLIFISPIEECMTPNGKSSIISALFCTHACISFTCTISICF